MNPLNSIINFSRVLYQKTMEFIDKNIAISDLESKSSNSLLSKLNQTDEFGNEEPRVIEIRIEDLQ